MRRSTLTPELHLFVCANRRPDGSPLGPGCGAAGEAVYAEMKGAIARSASATGANLTRSVWITKTQCLGVCPKQGCTVAIYPPRAIFSEVDETEAGNLLAWAIEAGGVR